MMKSERDTKVKEHMALHLEEIMEDTDVYGWDKIRAFHAAWLNQMEQYRCEWPLSKQKLKMRSLISHAAITSKTPSTSSSAGSGKKHASNIKAYNSPAKPATKACEAFNSGKCFKGHKHPERQHICAFCFHQ